MKNRLNSFRVAFIEGINTTSKRDNNIMLSHLECLKIFIIILKINMR